MAAICGIDWAAEHHDVRIADEHSGAVLAERRFAHDQAGIAALIDVLIEHRVARVAIERPDGLLVGRLLAAGITMIAIHPNQVAAARDRFRAAAGKDDRFDATVLCELARTDHHHQLRAHLDAAWPGAARIFRDIDSAIALAFLERYPAASDARALGPKRLHAFLSRHAYRGRKTPDQLLQRLPSAPTAAIGEHETKARRTATLGLVAALRPLVAQISQHTSEIRGAIHRHPDGPIFLNLLRNPHNVICAAGLLAEIADNRARYPHNDTHAADAAQAPVTKQSGHPWTHDVYQRAINRGADHPHAIRILGRAWTRVLWRRWQDHTPYDPTQHRALTRHLAQQA